MSSMPPKLDSIKPAKRKAARKAVTAREIHPELWALVEEGDRKAALKLSRLLFEAWFREEALALRAMCGEAMTQTRWFRILRHRGGWLVRSEGLGVRNWRRIAMIFGTESGNTAADAIHYAAKLIRETIEEESEGGECFGSNFGCDYMRI